MSAWSGQHSCLAAGLLSHVSYGSYASAMLDGTSCMAHCCRRTLHASFGRQSCNSVHGRPALCRPTRSCICGKTRLYDLLSEAVPCHACLPMQHVWFRESMRVDVRERQESSLLLCTTQDRRCSCTQNHNAWHVSRMSGSERMSWVA